MKELLRSLKSIHATLNVEVLDLMVANCVEVALALTTEI